MKMYGYYEGSEQAGIIIFSPHDPDRKWNENLQNAEKILKADANNERINIIGEFAQAAGNIKLPFTHFYANELAVLKKYRGKGIGRKLLERAESDALKSGINYIALDTSSDYNYMLYRNWNYELFQEYFFKDLKCYKMFKHLNKKG
jgi:GNAT superfamily N-acetyltransferase